jgi:hypothetical protein
MRCEECKHLQKGKMVFYCTKKKEVIWNGFQMQKMGEKCPSWVKE